MLEIIIQFVKCPTHPKKQLAINKKPSSEIIVPSVKIKLLKKKKKKNTEVQILIYIIKKTR